MKKRYLVLAVIVLALTAWLTLPGAFERTDVELEDFYVGDGLITLRTVVSSSAGHVRHVRTVTTGEETHCYFYSAFGGINGRIGAKSEFDVPDYDFVDRIYFDAATGSDRLMMERNETTGEWEAVRG